jgi:hypothetical protein
MGFCRVIKGQRLARNPQWIPTWTTEKLGGLMKLAALLLISTISFSALASDELSMNEPVEIAKVEMEAAQSSNLSGLYKEFSFEAERPLTAHIVIAKKN